MSLKEKAKTFYEIAQSIPYLIDVQGDTLADELNFIQKEFANAEDNCLHKDAQELKKGLLQKWVRLEDAEKELKQKLQQLLKEFPEFPTPISEAVEIALFVHQVSMWKIKFEEVLRTPAKESDNLTPEEIADLKISEKELRSGKCKTFNTAEELIADLHEKRRVPTKNRKGVE